MQFVTTFFFIVLFLSVTELFLLVRVSAAIGFLETLALCVLTGILGGSLVRYQGLQTLRRLKQHLAGGRLPTDEIIDGVVLIVIGALLCVPGFVTDVLGFLMLIPPVRREAIAWFKKRLKPRFTFHRGPGVHFPGSPGGPPEPPGHGPFPEEKPPIIDAEFEKKPPNED
jgi:UPF0716 protein FxsA